MDGQQEILSLLRQIADNNTKKNTQHELEHEALRAIIGERNSEKELRLEIKKKVIEGSVKALLVGALLLLGFKVAVVDFIP